MARSETEPILGNCTVVFDHYASIPMREGYILTDAPSLVRTSDGVLLCAVPTIKDVLGPRR